MALMALKKIINAGKPGKPLSTEAEPLPWYKDPVKIGCIVFTAPVSIEVFRDEDKLEQSKSVTLTVEDCLTTSTTSQVQNELANVQLAQQLQQQL